MGTSPSEGPGLGRALGTAPVKHGTSNQQPLGCLLGATWEEMILLPCHTLAPGTRSLQAEKPEYGTWDAALLVLKSDTLPRYFSQMPGERGPRPAMLYNSKGSISTKYNKTSHEHHPLELCTQSCHQSSNFGKCYIPLILEIDHVH